MSSKKNSSSSDKENKEKRHFTRPLSKKIAIAFDFDDTLAPDSIGAFRAHYGLDNDKFWRERVQPRVRDGWDLIPAAFYSLIRESESRPKNDRVTRERLAEFGRNLEYFPGVREMFDRIRWTVHEIDSEVEVEYYLISCGVGEIIRNTKIADEFKHIWASEFAYDENGEIEFMARFISHTEKTRFLYQLSEGIDSSLEAGEAFASQADMPEEELHVPLSQAIYVGDGITDSPCFRILNQEKGVALGVFKPSTKEKWGEDIDVIGDGQRVSNLAPVDYSEGSELLRSLIVAAKSICYRIQLRELSVGE